jgi:hypothetical protein
MVFPCGKQTVVCAERGQQHSTSADGWVGSAHDTEITLTDVEQQKHLLAYDLGLGETDAAFHSPLMTIANMRVMKITSASDLKQPNHGDENDGKTRMSTICSSVKSAKRSSKKGRTKSRHCVEITSDNRSLRSQAGTGPRAEIAAEISQLQDDHAHLRVLHHDLQHRTDRRHRRRVREHAE